MPRRQGWNTDDILCMGDDYTFADAAKEIMFLWNEWADSVEDILRGMIDQMEECNISYHDYLSLVRQFASYPARPAFPTVDSDSLLSGVWNKWADAIESIHGDMKQAINHSIPLPREDQMLCAGQPIDFSLDPPPMYMAAHLRKMLRDGTVARDELADSMEDLSI